MAYCGDDKIENAGGARYDGLLEDCLRDRCGALSLPYWEAKIMDVPEMLKIIHSRDWAGQYTDYQRFFRVKHTGGHRGDGIWYICRNRKGL